MLDADGTYVAGDLPQLLSFFPDYDQVNGARTSEQGTHKALRVPTKWCIRKLAEWISGKKIPDLNTGMKVYKRDLMLHYLWGMPDGFSCVTSMSLAFLCNGHPVKYVTVDYRKRIGKSKFHPVSDTAELRVDGPADDHVLPPAARLLPARAAARRDRGRQGRLRLRLVSGKHTLQESDIILATVAVLTLVIGLLADLIVAQRRGAA